MRVTPRAAIHLAIENRPSSLLNSLLHLNVEFFHRTKLNLGVANQRRVMGICGENATRGGDVPSRSLASDNCPSPNEAIGQHEITRRSKAHSEIAPIGIHFDVCNPSVLISMRIDFSGFVFVLSTIPALTLPTPSLGTFRGRH